MKTLLFKPFEKYRETSLFIFGITATVAGSVLGSLFSGRFDGVLDVHFGGPVTWYHPLLDNVINILIISLFMFLTGLIINKKTRIVDILAAAIVARAPLYLVTVFNAAGTLSEVGQKIMNGITNKPSNPLENISSSEAILLVAFGLISILFIVWYIALMWNGFKVATNAKGAGHVVLFSVSILFSEILSKIFISIFT